MFRAARGYRYSVAVPFFGPRECFERRGTGAQGRSPVAKVHADGVASWQRPLRLASPGFAVAGAAEHEIGAIFAGCWEVQQSGWPPQARMRLRNASAMRVNIRRSECMRMGKLRHEQAKLQVGKVASRAVPARGQNLCEFQGVGGHRPGVWVSFSLPKRSLKGGNRRSKGPQK